MSRFVVDASVAVKWFLPEVHADAAVRLLEAGHALSAPDLLFPEVGSALWKRGRRGEATEREAGHVLRTLTALPLDVHSSRPLMALALELACRTRRTIYDSLYLALAMLGGGPVVTADSRLFAALRKTPLARHVLWVADL